MKMEKISTLNSLIGDMLCNEPELVKYLTRYAGEPAVFFQNAPGDSQSAWEGKSQYPRIIYIVDMQADAERKTSGQININIWCRESEIAPEFIEPIVRMVLCGVFLTPSDGDISYCMEWVRSDAVEIPEREITQRTQIIGVSMLFDIFAFPCQITSDPDPILTINEYTRDAVPGCRIIAYDRLPEIYIPSAENPAFYWRFGNMASDKVSWAVSWVTGTLTGHIFTPAVEDRLKWLKAISQQAVTDEEAIMPDGSPMFFLGLKADSAADHLRAGQIQIKVKYGILRKREKSVFGLEHCEF